MADNDVVEEDRTALPCYVDGPSTLPLDNLEGIGGLVASGENWEVEVRGRKTRWASRRRRNGICSNTAEHCLEEELPHSVHTALPILALENLSAAHDQPMSLGGGCDEVAGAVGPSTYERTPAPCVADTAQNNDEDDDDSDVTDSELALVIAEAMEMAGEVCTIHTLAQTRIIGNSLEEAVCILVGLISSGFLVVEGHEWRDGHEQTVIMAAMGGARLRLAAGYP